MSQDKLLKWVDLAVKNEKFLEYSVKVRGETGKGDGYLSKITFVTVTGSTKTKGRKILNLIVKTATTNRLLRQQIPIKHLFENEIHFYDQVVPAFNTLFQKEGAKENPLNFLPVCSVTHNDGDEEVLVVEDLKIKGFEVWDRRVPMTHEHIRLVLQTFGKWNAFSLAFKQKHPETFEKLVKQKLPMFGYYIIKVQIVGVLFKFFEDVRNFWKDDEEVTQISFSRDDIIHIISELVKEDPDHHVILHGDSWTNNFMFKSEKKNQNPVDLRIIDWQCTGLASPIVDLSVFIYCCVDTEVHKDVETLLKIYYETLSEHLVHLGCNPSEVFSYGKLMEHWKKFSKYGLLLGTFLLKFCLAEGDEAPDFVETAEQGKEFLENFHFNISNKEAYFKRIKSNILHYIKSIK